METFLHYLPILLTLLWVLIWGYLFIYSYRQKIDWPWAFGILFITVLIPRNQFILRSESSVVFSVDPWFVIILIGLLINLNDIQKQVTFRDGKKIILFTVIGIILGLLIGIFDIATNLVERYIQIGMYTPFALVASSIQRSLTEEFLFRGFLLGYLRKFKFNPLFAILLQAFIFTAFHLSRYFDNWLALSINFMMGVLAGYITWKSDNLLPTSCLHVVGNLFAVIWHIFIL